MDDKNIKSSQYKVNVYCTTYNHAKYILNAMDGFCMQVTNFPFVCTIIDDASTDGQQDVIVNYFRDNFNTNDTNIAYERETDDLRIYYAQHKSNPNCHFAIVFLKENQYSKTHSFDKSMYIQEWLHDVPYVAMCEGDDYWITEDKLQKQVDWMDANKDYSLCGCSTNLVQDYKLVGQNIKSDTDIDIHVEDIISKGGFFLNTCSLMYRTELASEMPHWRQIADVLDHPLCILLGLKGKVRFLSKVMCCYRVASEGSWSSNTLYNNKKTAKHYYQVILWLSAMDEETGGKYHKSVYRLINEKFFYSTYIYGGFPSLDAYIKLSFKTHNLSHILCIPMCILFPCKYGLYFVILLRTIKTKMIEYLSTK